MGRGKEESQYFSNEIIRKQKKETEVAKGEKK